MGKVESLDYLALITRATLYLNKKYQRVKMFSQKFVMGFEFFVVFSLTMTDVD
jgi:hypothetical protein